MEVSIRHLTKRFGQVHAVEDLSFEVSAGQVTGFVGPNGAGKTTTLRILMNLVRATSGEALFDGRRYVDLPHPRRAVGCLLEATGFHPGRRGRDHLRILAGTTGVGPARVDEVLELVGLTGAADRRIGGYSLGMRQRLGLASALVSGPQVLILDEPANGLDPEGIAWLRGLLRGLADSGCTVLLSSHVLSELAQIVDQVVIVNHGALRYAGGLDGLGRTATTVRTGEAVRFAELLRTHGLTVEVTGPDLLNVSGADAEQIGRIALEERVVLSSLAEAVTSLETAFLALTGADERPGPAADDSGSPAPAGLR